MKSEIMDTAIVFDPINAPDGLQGYEYLPDGKVHVRLNLPKAKEVLLDQFGIVYPLMKAADGAWDCTLDMGTGFKYFFLKVDGADVLSPYLPIGYGCNRPMNFFDIPIPESVSGTRSTIYRTARWHADTFIQASPEKLNLASCIRRRISMRQKNIRYCICSMDTVKMRPDGYIRDMWQG